MENTGKKRKRDRYIKIDDKMRQCTFWLNKKIYDNTIIKKKVGLFRDIVRGIMKTIDEIKSHLPLKSIRRHKKINLRGLRQLGCAAVCKPFMNIQQA